MMPHGEVYGAVIAEAFKKNLSKKIVQPVEPDVLAFSAGFIDGVSWCLKQLKEHGVALPEGCDLLMTEDI